MEVQFALGRTSETAHASSPLEDLDGQPVAHAIQLGFDDLGVGEGIGSIEGHSLGNRECLRGHVDEVLHR